MDDEPTGSALNRSTLRRGQRVGRTHAAVRGSTTAAAWDCRAWVLLDRMDMA